ncbi:unnamed protein product [Vitrella brassicaformis CCMP3155]|uniref:non-specific serine/threonine protein kinase n=1 Tax=Vitrella brassicaformis (strain CCMP3155) TaxID=1169540 RepID=A0A0G4EV73_VITBC|nr:unnamed protein product [Vitrella brassicaformis CCMP3155]|eukprot:CEM02242.1 unnamed protein product [Vitrella brassicaformis CCMP3155]
MESCSRADLELGSLLGEGSLGKVYRTRDKRTNEEYAVKVLEKRYILQQQKQASVVQERRLLSALNHPNIVQLYSSFQDDRFLYFVLELAKGGDLGDQIKRVGRLPYELAQFYAAEVVKVLEYLREKQIAHRDLKPENLLIGDNGHLKLIDFDGAKCFAPALQGPPSSSSSRSSSSRETGQASPGQPRSGDSSMTSSPVVPSRRPPAVRKPRSRANTWVGTAQYVSPEMLEDNDIASYPSDLWALGCILYQMLAGCPPFKAETEFLTFQRICRCDIAFPNDMPAVARDLVSQLLVVDPQRRLGSKDMDRLKSHPFFDGVEFDTLPAQTPPKIEHLLRRHAQPPGNRHADSSSSVDPLAALEFTPSLGESFGGVLRHHIRQHGAHTDHDFPSPMAPAFTPSQPASHHGGGGMMTIQEAPQDSSATSSNLSVEPPKLFRRASPRYASARPHACELATVRERGDSWGGSSASPTSSHPPPFDSTDEERDRQGGAGSGSAAEGGDHRRRKERTSGGIGIGRGGHAGAVDSQSAPSSPPPRFNQPCGSKTPSPILQGALPQHPVRSGPPPAAQSALWRSESEKEREEGADEREQEGEPDAISQVLGKQETVVLTGNVSQLLTSPDTRPLHGGAPPKPPSSRDRDTCPRYLMLTDRSRLIIMDANNMAFVEDICFRTGGPFTVFLGPHPTRDFTIRSSAPHAPHTWRFHDSDGYAKLWVNKMQEQLDNCMDVYQRNENDQARREGRKPRLLLPYHPNKHQHQHQHQQQVAGGLDPPEIPSHPFAPADIPQPTWSPSAAVIPDPDIHKRRSGQTDESDRDSMADGKLGSKGKGGVAGAGVGVGGKGSVCKERRGGGLGGGLSELLQALDVYLHSRPDVLLFSMGFVLD